MKFLMFILFFGAFSGLLHADPYSGVVKSYSQQSDWKNQKHFIHIDLLLGEEGTEKNPVHSFIMALSVQDMVEIVVNEKDIVTIVEEMPDELVGQSLFQLQIGDNPKVFAAKGVSIRLTPSEWGVDENSFMVTKVALPIVTFNGTKTKHVNSVSGDILGKIFSKYQVENFIPNKPGISSFTYFSQDGENYFSYEAPSKDVHWTPLPEQLVSPHTVKWSFKTRTGMTGEYFYVRLSGDIELGFSPGSSYHAEGNRWIKVGDGWVDLDRAFFLSKGPKRNLVKTWE